jgi:hypothetical protein
MQTTMATIGKEREAGPETRLWQAVITHTIQEWVSGPLRRQREAEQFLFSDNSDFLLVCESAGMDAKFLRTRLAKLRKQSVTAIGCTVAAQAERCHSERRFRAKNLSEAFVSNQEGFFASLLSQTAPPPP